MKNGSLNKAGLLFFAAVLFIGVFLQAGLSEAQEEDMGITVSCAPEGWTPNAAVGRAVSWLPFTAGGVTVLLLAGGIFMLRRKTGNKISGAEELADKSSCPAEFKPQPAAAEAQPVTARTPLQFVQQRSSPARQVLPECRPPIAEKPAPVLQPETPPPVPSPASSTVSVPVVKAPAVVVPAPKPEAEYAPNLQERNNDEEDMLFKHLDLLKQLRNKES